VESALRRRKSRFTLGWSENEVNTFSRDVKINITASTQAVIIDLAKKKVVVSLHNFLRILRSLSDLKEKYTTDVFTAASFNPVVAKLFDPRAEFATAWPLKGRIPCDLRNLCNA